MIETKVCSACKQELPADCFHKHSKSKDGLQSMCKDCFREYNKKYRKENKAWIAERDKGRNVIFKIENPTYHHDWYMKNKDHIKAYNKAWREANKERKAEQSRRYFLTHKDQINAYRRAWYARKKAIAINSTEGVQHGEI